MTSDTRTSVRPRASTRTTLALAACVAAVALGAAARSASASHDERRGGGVRFSDNRISITLSDRGLRIGDLPVRHGQRFGQSHWRRQPVLSDFERGVASGQQLGERIGYRDGYAGRASCLEPVNAGRPFVRNVQAYLDGFHKGYRTGYRQGYIEGRLARLDQPCH